MIHYVFTFAADVYTCNLKACHALFTKEALIVEREVVWRGDRGKGFWCATQTNPVHLAESEPQQESTSSAVKIEEKRRKNRSKNRIGNSCYLNIQELKRFKKLMQQCLWHSSAIGVWELDF